MKPYRMTTNKAYRLARIYLDGLARQAELMDEHILGGMVDQPLADQRRVLKEFRQAVQFGEKLLKKASRCATPDMIRGHAASVAFRDAEEEAERDCEIETPADDTISDSYCPECGADECPGNCDTLVDAPGTFGEEE